jgi:DNA-binding transcriptional LysR family regulator
LWRRGRRALGLGPGGGLTDVSPPCAPRQLDVILVPSVTDATGCQRRRIDAEPLHYLPRTEQAAAASNTNGQPIELTELSGQPLVMVGEACGLTTFTRALFATTGAQLRSYPGEADSYRSLEDWANLGLGGALMPASRFRGDKPTRPVHDHGHPITISYEALWLTHTPRKQAIETLLDTVLSST